MNFSARDLTVSIASHVACRGLSFELATGDSLAILGRNGAGKSTLLATLAGLRPADAGTLAIGGRALGELTPRALAALRAYCPQQQHDAFAASVLETALIGRHPHLGRWEWENDADRTLALDALDKVGLSGFAKRQVQTLSGGERQRLAIATLLVQSPAICMLDEPLTHLDLNHAMGILQLLKDQSALQRSLIAVMHEPNLARRHFRHALLLFGDGSWSFGETEAILTAENLARLYNHPVRVLDDGDLPWFIPE